MAQAMKSITRPRSKKSATLFLLVACVLLFLCAVARRGAAKPRQRVTALDDGAVRPGGPKRTAEKTYSAKYDSGQGEITTPNAPNHGSIDNKLELLYIFFKAFNSLHLYGTGVAVTDAGISLPNKKSIAF